MLIKVAVLLHHHYHFILPSSSDLCLQNVKLLKQQTQRAMFRKPLLYYNEINDSEYNIKLQEIC